MIPCAATLALALAAAGPGRVISATATRGYLDAGSVEGLEPGAVVQLERNGRPSASCRVDEVSDHHAACAGEGIRVGDAFALPDRPAAPVKELPPLPSPEEQARRLAAVESAPVALVPFQATPGAAPSRTASEVALGFASWMSNVAGPDQQARLDVSIQDVEVARNLRLSVDLRALEWIRRTSTTYLPGPRHRSSSSGRRSWTGGIRRARTASSWGASGPGSFPARPSSMVRRWGCASGAARSASSAGSSPTRGRPRPRSTATRGGVLVGRGAHRVRPPAPRGPPRLRPLSGAGKSRRARGRGRPVALASAGRLRRDPGRRGSVHAPAYLDLARIAFFGRPADPFSFNGGFGYVGLTTPEESIVRAAWPGPSRRGDLTLSFDASRFLVVSATGGVVQDLTSDLVHGWAGPELSFPRFLSPRVALSAGWLVDLGWLQGQNAYLQVSAWPGDTFRLAGRFSWYRDDRPGLPSAPADELGLQLSGSVQIVRWLAFRFSVLARSGVDFSAMDGYGFTSLATLAGGF